MLHLGRLRLLHEFSILGTVSAVAEAVHLTRPAVSQQLDLLEQELGVSLFQRQGRNLRLTPAGSLLADRCTGLFQLVNNIESEVASFRDEVAGEVRMVAFSSVMIGLLPEILRYLQGKFPKLQISLREEGSVAGLRALIAGQADIAISHTMGDVSSLMDKVETIPYCRDFLYLILSARHRYADAPAVSLSNLAGEKWVFDMFSVGYHKGLTKAFATAGYEPDVLYNCYDMLATLEFVRRNDAVSILPGLSLKSMREDPDLRCVPVDPVISRNIFIATQKGTANRPAIRAVIHALTTRIPNDLLDWYLTPEKTCGKAEPQDQEPA